jgi:hypothetical protein
MWQRAAAQFEKTIPPGNLSLGGNRGEVDENAKAVVRQGSPWSWTTIRSPCSLPLLSPGMEIFDQHWEMMTTPDREDEALSTGKVAALAGGVTSGRRQSQHRAAAGQQGQGRAGLSAGQRRRCRQRLLGRVHHQGWYGAELIVMEMGSMRDRQRDQ